MVGVSDKRCNFAPRYQSGWTNLAACNHRKNAKTACPHAGKPHEFTTEVINAYFTPLRFESYAGDGDFFALPAYFAKQQIF